MGRHEMRRRLLTLVAAVSVVLAGAVPALADDGARRLTEAIAVTSGGDVVDTAFDVIETRSKSIDHTNQAVAYASDCTGCDALAISFQIVLASDGPTDIGNQNYAVALNERCDSCHTGAFAKQAVVTSTGRLELTEAGEERLEDIEEELEEYEEDWEERLEDGAVLDVATLNQIDAQVDAWWAEVREVLQTQVVKKGAVVEDADDDEAEDHDDDDD